MTKAPFLLLCVALVLLAAVPVAAAAQPRSVHVARSWPLEVRGSGFYARERVRVTVHMGNRVRVARTRTDGRGAFTAHFPGLRLDACALPLTIRARGARGDTASSPRPIRDCAS